MKTEHYTCQHCGKGCERPTARGQKPKWCSQRCADLGKKGTTATCSHCGTSFFGLGPTFCSVKCANDSRRKPKVARLPTPRKDTRSALRRAYESGDHGGTLAAVRAKSVVSDGGCWVWQGRIKNGYPVMVIGGAHLQAHRVSLEAALGSPLGTQAAHHRCANTSCVNPKHLQPVTHRENIAEMLARQSYLSRIRELEAALASVAPRHPLLAVVKVA